MSRKRIELYLHRDDIEDYITREYSVDLNRNWLESYIRNDTEYNSLEEFLDYYNSEDVEGIISVLDDTGEPYSLKEENSYYYYDENM